MRPRPPPAPPLGSHVYTRQGWAVPGCATPSHDRQDRTGREKETERRRGGDAQRQADTETHRQRQTRTRGRVFLVVSVHYLCGPRGGRPVPTDTRADGASGQRGRQTERYGTDVAPGDPSRRRRAGPSYNSLSLLRTPYSWYTPLTRLSHYYASARGVSDSRQSLSCVPSHSRDVGAP